MTPNTSTTTSSTSTTGPGATAGTVEIETGEVVSRLWSGQRLSRDERDHLSGVIGAGAARRLTRQLAGEHRQARKARPPRGFWGWMFGPVHTGPEPLPDSVARVLLRIRDGELIDRDDLSRLARVVGGRAARELHRHLHQPTPPRRRRPR